VNKLIIPVAQASFKFGLDLALLARRQLLEEQAELLPERVQALPPGAAAVLVHVADEDFVEQVVNVEEHGPVVWSCEHEGRGRHGGGGRRHLGLGGGLVDDGHCKEVDSAGFYGNSRGMNVFDGRRVGWCAGEMRDGDLQVWCRVRGKGAGAVLQQSLNVVIALIERRQ
jgi:hypothetical protein